MTELLTHPATVTLLMAALLTAMNVAAYRAIAKLTSEQQKRLPAVVSVVVIGIMSSVIAVPTINHLWAEHREEQNERRALQREVERQQREVRDKHLERLRPVLLSDSKKLLELSSQLSIEGTAIGGFVLEDYEPRLDRDYWYPKLLYRDLAAHFPDYGKVRERVRGEVFAQQKETLDLQRLAREQVKLTPQEGNADGVAAAIVRHCMGIGNGVSLEIDPSGGYLYDNGHGSRESGGGEPPAYSVNAVKAFRAFRPTDSFRTSCDTLTARAKRLAADFNALSTEAAIAAESAALFGECSYVRLP